MKICRCLAVISLVMLLLAPAAMAVDSQPLSTIKIVDASRFSVAMVLEENVGRQVEVTVNSGATFKGKLAGVGGQAVHLSELVGKEFYDAVIEKSAIEAVVLRTRER